MPQRIAECGESQAAANFLGKRLTADDEWDLECRRGVRQAREALEETVRRPQVSHAQPEELRSNMLDRLHERVEGQPAAQRIGPPSAGPEYQFDHCRRDGVKVVRSGSADGRRGAGERLGQQQAKLMQNADDRLAGAAFLIDRERAAIPSCANFVEHWSEKGVAEFQNAASRKIKVKQNLARSQVIALNQCGEQAFARPVGGAFSLAAGGRQPQDGGIDDGELPRPEEIQHLRKLQTPMAAGGPSRFQQSLIAPALHRRFADPDGAGKLLRRHEFGERHGKPRRRLRFKVIHNSLRSKTLRSSAAAFNAAVPGPTIGLNGEMNDLDEFHLCFWWALPYNLRERFERINGRRVSLFGAVPMVATTSHFRRQAVVSLPNAARESLPDAMAVEVEPTTRNLRERAERLLDREIQFIPSAEFGQLDAEAVQTIDLEESLDSGRKSTTVPEGIPAYLASLYRTPLLTPVRERQLFRKYNFLKWLARREQVSLKASRPSRAKIERIEQLLADAALVRNQIVQANLRLVVANARKYADAEHGFDDLVSDGNLTLVQAVEKFDYSRGFRFSTYATHAIRRTFFRRMDRRQKERARLTFAAPELIQTAPQPEPDADQAGPADLVLFEALVERMRDRLSEREMTILKARYSLETGEDAPTLQVLARELGICKERVRQLQIRAIGKLRELAGELQSSMNLEPSMLEV